MAYMALECRRGYENQDARISISAEVSSSRPDTLVQLIGHSYDHGLQTGRAIRCRRARATEGESRWRRRSGTLVFFDPLLAGAAVVVEGNDALGWSCRLVDDEADAWIKLARMPLDLGDRSVRRVP